MIPEGQSIEIHPTPSGTFQHNALANPKFPNSSHLKRLKFDLNVKKQNIEGKEIIVKIKNIMIMYRLKLKKAFTLYPRVVIPF